jgi:hypothetical protein
MLAWDRTHDWVVERYFNDLTRIVIHFQSNQPSAQELLALRRVFSQFRDVPPSQIRDAVGGCGKMDIGEMPTHEARGLVERASAEGLIVDSRNVSTISQLPVDRTTGRVWLIEDERDALAVIDSMIAAGIPVRDILA